MKKPFAFSMLNPFNTVARKILLRFIPCFDHLGAKEVNSILKEFGEVIVSDDICNRKYRLDALAIDAIFREVEPTIH